MAKYKISGTFMKKGFENIYRNTLSAENKERAVDKFFSLVGSNHKVKRNQLHNLKVEEIND